MKVLRLHPSEISEHWERLRSVIQATVPGVKPDDKLMTNILSALLKGLMWCWVTVDSEGLNGIITATVTQEICLKIRNLFVYSVGFARTPTNTDFLSILHVMVVFAKTQGCERLCGMIPNQTALESIAKLKNVVILPYAEVRING